MHASDSTTDSGFTEGMIYPRSNKDFLILIGIVIVTIFMSCLPLLSTDVHKSLESNPRPTATVMKRCHSVFESTLSPAPRELTVSPLFLEY